MTIPWSVDGIDVFPFFITETMSLPCLTEEHRDRMEAAREEIGRDVWEMLYQARGWASTWLEGKDDVIVKAFIDKIDKKLCLTRKGHNDDTN